MPRLAQTINKEFIVSSVKDLSTVAKWLKTELNAPSLILLKGQLGTGKTALAKSFLSQFDIPEQEVKSPTYNLINLFIQGGRQFAHLDLYRLPGHDQFLLEEIKELLFTPNTVMLIEWPEKIDLTEVMLDLRQLITVELEFTENNCRKIRIHVKNQHKDAKN